MTTPQWPPWPGASPHAQPPHGALPGYPPPAYHQGGFVPGPYPPPIRQPAPNPAAPNPAAPKPPPHRWGFGAFLLAEAVFLATAVLVRIAAMLPYLLRGEDPPRDADGLAVLPGPMLVVALALPPLAAAAVALIATRVRGNGPVIDLRLRFGWRDVGIGVACGFAGLVLTIPLSWLWVYVVGEDRANSAVGEVFDGLTLPVVLAVLVFLDVWLLAPICEEILYRGLLWGAMERREWNRWIVLGISTAVFALAHFEPVRAPLLLFIGLPIGLARMLSGRLAAPVIAHQVNNLLPALWLMLVLLGHPIGG